MTKWAQTVKSLLAVQETWVQSLGREDPLEKGMITHSSILTPLSMGFLRQEYWTWLPHPPPGDLPNPGIEPMSFMSPALAGRFFITSTTWDTPVGYDFSLKTCETALKVV